MRKIFSFIAKLLFVAAAIGTFVWFFGEKFGFGYLRQAYKQRIEPVTKIDAELSKKFPELSGQKEVVFQWRYKGNNYEISEKFYKSAYNFYKDSSKSFEYYGELPPDWKEKYFGMFLARIPEDETIDKLAEDIKKTGLKNKLSDDQIAELAVAFVQAIPYDAPKAELILSGTQNEEASISYPYETLYEQKGICSDKSFLTAVLLRKLGYGTVLFVYDAENHMAVGIQCPKEYSSYGSGYCYIETTAEGSKIGLVPNLDPKTNQAVTTLDISNFRGQEDVFGGKSLSQSVIYQKNEGKEYQGIIKTISVLKKIETLRKDINSSNQSLSVLKKEISFSEGELENLKKKMDKLLENGKYDEYNKLVNDYNDLARPYKKKIEYYNNRIKAYNSQVNEYNNLIKTI